MGFDISYHPVDLEFFEDGLLQYLVGDTDLGTLAAEATERERLRARAKEWALLALKVDRERVGAHLRVWGRPFLIAAEEPAGVSREIDRYLAARTIDQVDAIARDNFTQLGLEVPPGVDFAVPDDDTLTATAMGDLAALPGIIRALRKGETCTLPSGKKADPADVLRNSFPLVVMQFASRFRPGWMDRGHVWPTHLLSQAKLPTAEFFEPAWALFGGVLAKRVGGSLRATIDQNYTVGGFVRANRVPALRKLFQTEQKAILAGPRSEGWEDEARVSLRKLDEALADAEHRKFAFLEASEVYSGPSGIMN